MKKLILIFMISMLFISAGVVCEAYEKPLRFTVDGKMVIFNESTGFPYVANTGRTMMPLRICLNSIGCEVNWNEQAQTVVLRKSDTEIEVPIGKSEIRINQMLIPVDTVAIVKNGRAYIPLRTVMEAYGYVVNWDEKTGTISATLNSGNNNTLDEMHKFFTPFNINGGSTGIFSRKQLQFEGYDGIQADITLPTVTIDEKGDCPYVYFGFDWKDDEGNVEGGFQFIEDSNHPSYNKWTVFMRQGNDWRWGNNIALEQGSTHHIKFYSEEVSEKQVDLVIELDGSEIIRKVSTVTNFNNASVKAVTSMAMSKTFDGSNCASRLDNSKIANMTISEPNSDQYVDFKNYRLYSEWRSTIGDKGTWFGTVDCLPSYLHYGNDGSISIYKGQ